MLSYRSNPIARSAERPVTLSKRDLKSLRTYAGMTRWPAAYLDRPHPDRALVEIGLLKVETGEIAGEEMRFVSITQAGRNYLAGLTPGV